MPGTAPPAAPVLIDRVLSLAQAVKLGAGRSPQPALSHARQVVQQVDRRLALSGDRTVVALAGATGSGKSSLFNALCGSSFAPTGVTRPTTGKAMAASWGVEPPRALLDWLKVTQHHLVAGGDARLTGLTLLDLPDHDSTQGEHRLEVDRLVRLVDGLVWVLDPQKYADNLVHERYLRPMSRYADVMIVVLNHADELPPAHVAVALDDLRRLLREEGLGDVRVMATSALTGSGLEDLRAELFTMVRDKRLAAARLSHDVSEAASGLVGDLSRNRNRQVSSGDLVRLRDALAAASGVPEVTQAVWETTRLRGSAVTGWPLVSWINRLRPDPLKMLRMDRLASGSAPHADESPAEVPVPRTSLRVNAGARRARLDSALRTVTDNVSAGLPLGWAQAVREAGLTHAAELDDSLDRAVAETDVGVQRPLAWWNAVRIVHWVLVAAAVAGLVWLVGAGTLGAPLLRWHGLLVPGLALIGGLVVGVVLGVLARVGVEWSARHRAGLAHARLLTSVDEVADRLVIAPVNAELERYSAFVAALARAL
ncbi:MAG: 50S ribosome-binding GTPase [Actinomycetia bacterium]|nr:50S ribosome-binding GTPase [Actinomycetes bacterium]